jgi:hypothetical protein
MRKIPNSQELKQMAQTIINHYDRYGEDYLIIYCRNIPQRNGQEHQLLSSILHCGCDMVWNFLQVMNWCLRYACGEKVPEKLDMLLELASSDKENEIDAKFDLLDNMTEMIEWLKTVNARYDARLANLHNWE